MAKNKKEIEAVTFEIPDGDLQGRYQVIRAKINVPRLGVVNAKDLVEMPEVLEHLVQINSGAVKKIAHAAPKEEKEGSPELIAARQEFEQLIGKPAGNRKLETLLKEIENLKGK